MPLSAQQVRDAGMKHRKTRDVEAPEMEGAVRFRALSAGDIVRMNYEKQKAILEGRDPQDLAFEYVALSWINDDGDLLFPLVEGIAVARSLGEKPFDAFVAAVLELNGLTAGATEEIAKN